MMNCNLWKDMLSWVFFYVSLGLFLWGAFSIWHGEKTARFFIRKYGRWKAMMKYERKHRFCPYSPFHLWYERYYPENQFEYRLFKRAIYKSRILNVLAIQFLANVLATWIKWYVIAECCYVKYKESIVELFREDAVSMLAIYIIFPGILTNLIVLILNYCDRKRGA